MNANQIVTLMGGRQAVIKITGLTKGRISQWVNQDHIPAPWLAAFRAMKPDEFAELDQLRLSLGEPNGSIEDKP